MSGHLPNSALALHEILRRFLLAPTNSVGDAWSQVLGCATNSAEFPRRHAEVIGLFTDTVTRAESLPDGVSLRERVTRYAPQWYAALVHQNSWSTNQHLPSAVLNEVVLDHLLAIGEQMSERRDEQNLDRDAVGLLLQNLTEWEELLTEGDLPEDIVGQVKGHVAHIRWLVENVALFGGTRILAETTQLAGVAVTAMTRSSQRSVRERIGYILAGLLFCVNQTNGFVENVNGILDGVATMPDRVHELVLQYQAPLELDSSPTRLELEEGKQPVPDDAIDAETVEDEGKAAG